MVFCGFSISKNKKQVDVKTMLTFCEKCGNIMVLKEKLGRNGEYECRTCGLIKNMKVEIIELREKIFEEPVATLMPKQLKLPMEF